MSNTITIKKGEPLELEIIPRDLLTGDPLAMSSFDSVACWMTNGAETIDLSPTIEEDRVLVSFATGSLTIGNYTADIRFTTAGKDQFTDSFRVLLTTTASPPSA
jgi:hypothetical protein